MRLLLFALLLLPLPAAAFELTLDNGDRVIVDENNIFRGRCIPAGWSGNN